MLQKLKECALVDYKEFMNYIYSLRGKFEKENIFPVIYNMDEKPIYLEPYSNKTFEKIGTSTVYNITHDGEKIRLTLILCINSKGEQLPALLIFKILKMVKKRNFLIIVQIGRIKKYLFYAKKILGLIRHFFNIGLKIFFSAIQ